MTLPVITELWDEAGFRPNENQREAILHTEGPLFLTAGPGSGKTRVLLWRTLNLIVYQGVDPAKIFLATFTDKAALQLKEGLQSLLVRVTNRTGNHYDLSGMYIGTIHSLCQKLLQDRRFIPNRARVRPPVLLDDHDQYFFVRTSKTFGVLMDAARVSNTAEVNSFFKSTSSSPFVAVTNCIALFNRFSEENLEPVVIRSRTTDERLLGLIDMYACYKKMLVEGNKVDFSLLQQRAFNALSQITGSDRIFRHVIIDEYQDTNSIQEQLIFKLAGVQNLCVVGDDDQALYRFRGARVENFVEFPERCRQYLNREPRRIPLNINYRSRQEIVSFYRRFIDNCDWTKENGHGAYRVTTKQIMPYSKDSEPAVVATSRSNPQAVAAEIARLVKELLKMGKVQDPNQIAFLFPSLKYKGEMTSSVKRMKEALENVGLRIYAPRAGIFLDVDEAVSVMGIFLHIFGMPERSQYQGAELEKFQTWLDRCYQRGQEMISHDKPLARYVAERVNEIDTVINDYLYLQSTVESNGWQLDGHYQPELMRARLLMTEGISERARRHLSNQYMNRIIEERLGKGKPLSLSYIINAATALDWNILDLFYRIIGFDSFKAGFEAAENGEDEGPVCNLSILSQYLASFLEKFSSILSAGYIQRDIFHRQFFNIYLYSLYRRGESEYEDVDDPFPKGRIPFLTVHQSKGLEFPVVILGSLNKRDRLQDMEGIIHPLLDRTGEPLDRSPQFDNMRIFYVAMSRAQNLLVLPNPSGVGQQVYWAFNNLLNNDIARLPNFDVRSVPEYKEVSRDIPRTYSYTADYLMFQRCPRQYMLFRKYGFVPSRSQTQFFGNLVHQTIEDLHHYLIARREKKTIAIG